MDCSFRKIFYWTMALGTQVSSVRASVKVLESRFGPMAKNMKVFMKRAYSAEMASTTHQKETFSKEPS
jgi:hypothetical protein